jgi:predicted permease
LRSLLVISEVAVSLILLTGAGLLVRSFVRLAAVPPGFRADHVISMRVAVLGPRYREDAPVIQFYQQVRERILRLPGVKSEGTVSALPLTSTVGWGHIDVEGFTPAPGQELQTDFRLADADYFPAMNIPLVAGRFFTPHDTPDSQSVVIIDARFAQRFWPHGDAIGKHVWFDPKKPITIVGVVGAVKEYGLDTDGKIVNYFPTYQQGGNVMYLVARTTSDPAAMAASMVREIHAVEQSVAVYDVRTMEDRLHDSLARQRFATVMLTAFAAFALILAAVGVYGVMSFQVTQSSHDIGVRIALGAGSRNILSLVVRQGMTLAGAGVGAGLVGAALLTRAMSALLFGVGEHDFATFSAVTAFLLATAFLASYLPARRATRLDPLRVLRDE